MAILYFVVFAKELIGSLCDYFMEKKIYQGPKPFKVLNSWRQVEGYEQFIKEKWKELTFEGWRAYVLKEKFKALKNYLKEWRKNHVGVLENKLKEANEGLEGGITRVGRRRS